MKNLFLTAVAMVSLGACHDFSTPQGVIGSAADAMKENSLRDFRETLTPEAQAGFGNAQAFQELRMKLSGYQRLKIEKVTLVERRGEGTYYTAEITGACGASRMGAAAEVSVVCATRVDYEPESCIGNASGGGNSNQGQYTYCRGARNVERNTCLINKIELAAGGRGDDNGGGAGASNE